ncbi:S24/S26 family peptidase [Coraliomargarita parva]|uniref:S24/S26 family peptidase n=1 Tax=Coraliomargarita parva TaxID=3014050 RepID=UPI0022B493F9|nr:S24/S26 family peptidase [Coraliomargarita parva]
MLLSMRYALLGTLFFAALFLLSACNTTSSGSTTTFAPIKYDEAFKLGQMVKFNDSGLYMARTSGTSMEPVLTKNTIIVVRPIDFEDLEVGMIVGYLNKDGYQVLHQLIRKAGKDAWVAKGINNVTEDKDRVTPKNLVGVLYTVLYNEASQKAPR